MSIQLETTTRMPHVAPHGTVVARCGGATDENEALFTDLSNARLGDRIGHRAPIRGPLVRRAAASCEVTLSLSEGATPPQRYCFQGGRTVPGACQ